MSLCVGVSFSEIYNMINEFCNIPWYSILVWYQINRVVYGPAVTFPTYEIKSCMMMSSNEKISASLVLCEGNPPVTGGFPLQRPVTWSFDVFFDQSRDKRLSKQSRRQWFETPLRSLWLHLNGIHIVISTQICHGRTAYPTGRHTWMLTKR